MRSPSRLTIALLVTVATLVVCSLGVRAELKTAKNSIAERSRTPPAQQSAEAVAASRDEHEANLAPR